MKKKLTGKCKEEFLKQLKFSESIFINTSETFQNALIIDWFDSVGIWEEIFEREYLNNTNNFKITCEQAIEKANTIYNET